MFGKLADFAYLPNIFLRYESHPAGRAKALPYIVEFFFGENAARLFYQKTAARKLCFGAAVFLKTKN